MTLDERTSRPLYRQVADELREQIEHQELAPGGRLPTEAGLMQRYGVSRNTVRLALGLLRTEGLVITGQGRGSFVADVPVRHQRAGLGAVRQTIDTDVTDALTGEITDAPDGHRVEVRVSTHPAPAHVAERLGLPPGERVIQRRRLLHREGMPSHVATSYLSADLAADTELARSVPLRAGVAAVLADLGRPITRHSDEITVRMPSPVEAQELQIATGVPLLSVLRTAHDADAAVLVTSVLLPGDRHTLRYDLVVDTS